MHFRPAFQRELVKDRAGQPGEHQVGGKGKGSVLRRLKVPGAHCSVLLSFPLFNHTRMEKTSKSVSHTVCKFAGVDILSHTGSPRRVRRRSAGGTGGGQREIAPPAKH